MIMIGNNRLQFNQATMIRIVQHYLDTVLLKDPGNVAVTQVEQGDNDIFVIFTSEGSTSPKSK